MPSYRCKNNCHSIKMSTKKFSFVVALSILLLFSCKTKEKKLKVADLVLNLNTRVAIRFNRKFTLRNKEFHLLEFLMRNTEIIFNRQKILEQVWDRNADMFTNTIDVHINILRRKLDFKETSRLIETIYCHGYVMHSKPFR